MCNARVLERNQVIQIGRLSGIKLFESERENFIFNTFIDFKSVKRFQNGRDTSGFPGFDNSKSKRVLNQLESIYLGPWNIVTRINSVIQEEICCKTSCMQFRLEWKPDPDGRKQRKSCHLYRDGDSENEVK